MFRFVEKKINLQQVFSEKICSVVYTLLLVVSQLSDFSKFHFEVVTLKKTLHKNAYPTTFDDKYIANFVNNIFDIFFQKPVFTTVLKLELRIVFPYLRNISSATKKRLNRCIDKGSKFYKLQIIFQTCNRLKNYFRFKIVFLKPYNLTLTVNLSVEVA